MNQGALTIQIEINWISGSGKVRFVLPFPKNSKKKKMEGKREKKRGERERQRERENFFVESRISRMDHCRAT